MIVVELTTLNEAALVAPNLTALAPVKFVPVIVTEVPTAPEDGVNVDIAGGGITVKLEELVALPDPVVNEILPVVVPAATTAVTVVELITLKDEALVPLKLTEVVPDRFDPVIVTLVPTGPEDGVNELIPGNPEDPLGNNKRDPKAGIVALLL